MWQYQCSDVATLWQHETHVRGSAVAVPWQCVMSIERYLRGSAVAVCHGSRKHVATPWQYTAMPKHFSFRGSWCRNVPNIHIYNFYIPSFYLNLKSIFIIFPEYQVSWSGGASIGNGPMLVPRWGNCLSNPDLPEMPDEVDSASDWEGVG